MPTSKRTIFVASLAVAAVLAEIGCGDGDAGPLDRIGDGVTIFGVTASGSLVAFNSTSPETLDATTAVSGVSGSIIGIDFRPAIGVLYAVDALGGIYTLDTATGAGTFVATVSTPLAGGFFGVDFNPVPDRLRIVSDSGQNLRVDVADGAATTDTPLAYAAGDSNAGATPNVVAAAYTNNVWPARPRRRSSRSIPAWTR